MTDWCDVDDCPAVICNGPHVSHVCSDGATVSVRFDNDGPCIFGCGWGDGPCTDTCGHQVGEYVELTGDDIPRHLRVGAPALECTACHRLTWSEIADVCGMVQPDGSTCPGVFV